jgi:chorismate dehydratase
MYIVGSVSFLNAAPLIDGLERSGEAHVITDVPSRLLDTLLSRRVSIALCPTIDYQTGPEELCLVPVGAIGSERTTLTVRVFSRVPCDRIEHVAVDRDSSTSVALLQVVLSDLFGIRPRLTAFNHDPTLEQTIDDVDALLLIGDKVVTSAPDPERFPHQLDLGEAWHRVTGLPFVFATWMAPVGVDLTELPELLRRRRQLNSTRIREIVAAAASSRGWSDELAEHYLGTLLRYRIGQRELEAVTLFWDRCHELGLIDRIRPLVLYQGDTGRE